MKHLSGWATEAKAHWQKYRPKMFKEMRDSGKLHEHLENAANRAKNQASASVEAGMDPWEAASEAKRQHLFLPSEDDQTELGTLNWRYGRKSGYAGSRTHTGAFRHRR